VVERPLRRLVAILESAGLCVVLADFSPKNILLSGNEVFAVDFETAHLGDPAFDVGFFLSHLALKSLRRSSTSPDLLTAINVTWTTYHSELADVAAQLDLADMAFEPRCLLHLGACMLARLDGKSPVDYLNDTEVDIARAIACDILNSHIHSWDQLLVRLASKLGAPN